MFQSNTREQHQRVERRASSVVSVTLPADLYERELHKHTRLIGLCCSPQSLIYTDGLTKRSGGRDTVA